MTSYFNLTTEQKETIRKAYEFEVDCIEIGSYEPNPYRKAVKEMGLWEAIQVALEMAYK